MNPLQRIVFGLFLSLVTLSIQAESEPDITQQSEFIQAKAYYDTQQYERALQAFEALWQSAPANPILNFYLGRSALELQRYDQAIAAFDRVLMVHPDHARTHLELARLYYLSGEYAMANTQLDIALRSELPDPVKQNIHAFRDLIQKADKAHAHAWTFILGLNFDSNANNDVGLNNRFTIATDFGDIELGDKETADIGLTQSVIYEHRYKFKRHPDWRLNNQISLFNQFNQNLPENNLLYVSAATSPSYQKQRYKLSFPIEIDKVLLDYGDYYNSFSLGGRYDRILSPTQSVSSELKLQRMVYDATPSLSAIGCSIAFGYRRALGKNPWYLSTRIGYENRKQLESHDTDPASLNEVALNLELTKPLNQQWRVFGAIGYRHVQYLSENPLLDSTRQDNISELALGGLMNINKASKLSARIGYSDHQSNQGPYDFNKTRFSLNYIYSL
jgi:tetratricopeptide (TPR) repeat protein